MSTQSTLINDLKSLIAERQVICVLGAGVSIAATRNNELASWPGLLRHGVERCMQVVQPRPSERWRETALSDIQAGVDTEDTDLLVSAAGKIESKLDAPRGPEYANWLRDGVGSLQISDNRLVDTIARLGLPIITTNYDSLIENCTGHPAVTARDPGDLERVVRGSEPGIIHLHGWWKHPETVVLGASSYERLLVNVHTQAVLRSLTLMKTLLFIGFGAGLSDPNFSALSNWAAAYLARSPYRRYRLMRTQDWNTSQKMARRDSRLFDVDYGSSFEDLPAFIYSLGGTASPRTAKSPLPQRRNAKIVSEVTETLALNQNLNVPLSQVLTKCLALAHSSDDVKLEEFCRGELEGWRLEKKEEITTKNLEYRLVEIYICLGAFMIDISAAQSAFGTEARLFEYFKSSTNDFKFMRFFMDMSISQLENRNRRGKGENSLAVYQFKIPAKNIVPDSKNVDFEFYAYAESRSVDKIFESVRQRLTALLLHLIPRLKSG